MSEDLISREALKKHIAEIFEIEEKIDKKWAMGLKYSLKIIDNAPTVIPDIEEFDKALHKWFEEIDEWEKKNGKIRPQGEWIKWNFKTFGAMGDWEYKCSNCEKVYGGEYNFCPNCGARMQKGGTE